MISADRPLVCSDKFILTALPALLFCVDEESAARWSGFSESE